MTADDAAGDDRHGRTDNTRQAESAPTRRDLGPVVAAPGVAGRDDAGRGIAGRSVVGPAPVSGDTWADLSGLAGAPGQQVVPRRRPGARTRGPLLAAIMVLAVVAAGFAIWGPLRDTGPRVVADGLGDGLGVGDGVAPVVSPTNGSPSGRSGFSATASPQASSTAGAISTPAQPPSPSRVAIAPRTGAILSAAGWCLDDLSSNATDGNPIQVWPCNGTPAESFTFGADATLRVLNRCVRPAGSTAPSSGTTVVLRACDGSRFQTWYYRSDQAIVNTDSGLCLTDSGVRTADSRYFATLAACAGSAGQRWILP